MNQVLEIIYDKINLNIVIIFKDSNILIVNTKTKNVQTKQLF